MEDIIIGKPLGPRIVSADAKENYMLLLTFSNGEKRLFDVGPLLELSVYKPLLNYAFFQSVRVEHGTVVWPQDIDCCPDTLYEESVLLS